MNEPHPAIAGTLLQDATPTQPQRLTELHPPPLYLGPGLILMSQDKRRDVLGHRCSRRALGYRASP